MKSPPLTKFISNGNPGPKKKKLNIKTPIRKHILFDACILFVGYILCTRKTRKKNKDKSDKSVERGLDRI
jgi:hypothetical protein